MNDVTNSISSTAQSSIDVVKQTSTDVIQFQFYKNPLFLLFVSYCVFIFISYAYMSNDTKNKYVFSDKFRDKDNNIYLGEILKYPYSFDSVPSIIKVIFTGPIILYVILFSILFSQFIDIKGSPYKPYFYSLMFSYLCLMILFSIHVFIVKYIVNPETVTIESSIYRKEDDKKTYESFYRTQWVLLGFLSPIYVMLLVYIFRKI